MRYATAIPEGVADVASAHLRRADGSEDLCFALWQPSLGRTRTTALIHALVLPRDGDRILQGNVAFTPQYFERALSDAREASCGLALMHSHPPGAHGWQAPSPDDYVAEQGIAAPIRAATGFPLVGLTIAGDGTWSARAWDRTRPHTYVPVFCESVRIVGDALRADFCDALLPRPEFRPRLERTRTAWGEDAHATLARLHVGVVGLGSVGSIVAEALARSESSISR